MTDTMDQGETVDAAPPSVYVAWTSGDDGTLTINMHKMSAPALYGIAEILRHEASKMLFAQEMAQREAEAKNGIGRLSIPGRH